MTVLERIQRAIDYIEEHLHDRCDVSDAAAGAGFSQFHFHRLFFAITGELPGAYIRKRKLTMAADEMLRSHKTILSIALDYGFETHESFTRAFRHNFGITPSHYRRARVRRTLYEKPILTKETILHRKDHISREPQFVSIPAIDVVGIEGTSTKNNNIIPQLWDRFLPRVKEIRNPVDEHLAYGLCMMPDEEDASTQTDDSEFTAVVSIPVSKVDRIPEGMVHRTIPAGEYAVFTHRGKFIDGNLTKSYEYIYGTWLPRASIKIVGKVDFELYDERFKGVDNDDTEIDIYIPIQR